MKAYFLRRILLIPPTLIGITLLVFVIVRLTPGGPVERELSSQAGGVEQRSGDSKGGLSLTPSQLLEIEEKFDRDKGILRSYMEWIGALPRDTAKVGREFAEDAEEVLIPMPGTVNEVTAMRDGTLEAEEGIDLDGWGLRIQSSGELAAKWKRKFRESELPEMPQPRAVLYRAEFDGLLQGSLGRSSKYQDPVWDMILGRMPISLFYGVVTMVLVYGVCLPLGIVKAIRHRSWLDNLSSLLVFSGYAVPGYALGSLLLLYLAAKLGWFPLGGFVGDGFRDLPPGEQVKDLLHHAVLPLLCYLVGSFAMMTMLVKNNLMDHLASDYVRTAVAKGASFQKAVFGHALRNSMIPVATTLGANVTLLVGGSVLIERIFDINGFGLLSFNSILEFDEPVIMGVLFVSALLMLIGNVISDLCVALVDPRVSYK